MIDATVSLPIGESSAVSNLVFEAPMPGISVPDLAFAAANKGLLQTGQARDEGDKML